MTTDRTFPTRKLPNGIILTWVGETEKDIRWQATDDGTLVGGYRSWQTSTYVPATETHKRTAKSVTRRESWVRDPEQLDTERSYLQWTAALKLLTTRAMPPVKRA